MQRYFAKVINNNVELSNDDLHHLTHVMRMRVGDFFEVVDNQTLYVCEITSLNPFQVKMLIKEEDVELIEKVKTDILPYQGVSMTKAGNIDIATKADKIAIYILAGLVGVTQVISILISQLRQKKQKAKSQSTIPEYRRPQQSDQQKQTALMMNIMLYGMAVMMVVLVIRRPAGLGLYWLVGNIYSTLQAQIGAMQSEKRLEKLRKKTNGGI